MLKIFFPLVLLLFAALTISTLLIRAKPYDTQDMRALFVPEGCEMPCFMGIRPGVTTVEQAVAALQASGQAEDVQIDRRLGFVNWEWSTLPPGVSGEQHSYLSFVQNTISIISLHTRFQYGDFFMHTPDFLNTWPATMGINEQNGNTTLTLWFERPEYSLRIAISCHDLWHSPVVVLLNANPLDFPLVTSIDNGLSVVNFIFHICGQDGSARLFSEQP